MHVWAHLANICQTMRLSVLHSKNSCQRFAVRVFCFERGVYYCCRCSRGYWTLGQHVDRSAICFASKWMACFDAGLLVRGVLLLHSSGMTYMAFFLVIHCHSYRWSEWSNAKLIALENIYTTHSITDNAIEIAAVFLMDVGVLRDQNHSQWNQKYLPELYKYTYINYFH